MNVPHSPELVFRRPPLAKKIGRADRVPAAIHEFKEIIESLAELVAVTDEDGMIVAANRLWQREVRRRRFEIFDVGHSYPAALEGMIAGGDFRLAPVLKAFNDVRAGTRASYRNLYIGSGGMSGADYNLLISSVELGGNRYLLVSAQDMTQVNDLKRQRRRLGSQVLHAQEAERRRLARELHDSTSQLLVVLKLNLMRLESTLGASDTDDVIAECKQAVDDVQQQIRGLSFLAHPPGLSSHNLADALEALTNGFAKRTGLDIQLQISDVGTASEPVEGALYRLVQESLANIYRHSAAKRAAIRLVGTDRCLHLLIADDGIGFDVAEQRAHPLGVGVVGMGERVRALRGRFSIRRADSGTALTVSLPRQHGSLSMASAA